LTRSTTKNVLGISSSPREGGNSDLLLDELLRGAEEGGCTVEKIRLAEKKIIPCTQCDHCQQDGSCVLEDDMDEIYARIENSDWLVLASPIYFMAHCAQAKLVIDRCQVFWARKYILKKPVVPGVHGPRRGVFVSVGATHGSKVFAGVKVTMKWFFDSLDMEYWGNLLFEGIDQKGAIREHPTALGEAYELGLKMAGELGDA
jgi:multimeric flavodoxin WrbA